MCLSCSIDFVSICANKEIYIIVRPVNCGWTLDTGHGQVTGDTLTYVTLHEQNNFLKAMVHVNCANTMLFIYIYIHTV